MTKSGRGRLPKIVVSHDEQERLSALAASISVRNPELAEELQGEMERARVVAPDKVPAGVVRMNSEVEFESDDGQRRRVTLVYPGDADISAGRISILTPIGTALIGLSEGQSITWTARDGREQRLTVLSVHGGGPEEPAQDGAEAGPVVDLSGVRAARSRRTSAAGAAGGDDPGPSAA
ncbi:MAG: nucleoside diphosphate kinase regulator [Pseudochelatococcus sp.]|uniref:nucleoside diphosphate kinase regulator n=1 Tax=Pseudochelatococcus sp. TaxID=2020869 RepID=UPI003D90C51E